MSGSVLRHARSIEANESRSNFGTGWAVGWVVWSSNPCKLLKELVGASGFEPPTSWSRTRRSSQAEPRPDLETAAKERNAWEALSSASVTSGRFSQPPSEQTPRFGEELLSKLFAGYSKAAPAAASMGRLC